MCRENIVRAVAGTLTLTGSLLALFVNIQWLWLCAFVGFNLLQSSFTRFCPLEKILEYYHVGKSKYKLK